MASQIIQLRGRDAKMRNFEIPKGYEVVTDGLVQEGDCYWNWGLEAWKTVKDSHSFLHSDVKNLQCVIRKGAPQ